MNPDMDPKHRHGQPTTVISPTSSTETYHHRNLATYVTVSLKPINSDFGGFERFGPSNPPYIFT